MLRSSLTAMLFGFTLLISTSGSAIAQSQASVAAHTVGRHKVIVQVSDSDPQKWQLALNNIANIQKDLGEGNVDIELVAFGPGIGMLKLDSKVADRIKEAVAAHVKVNACQNTMRGQHLTKDDMLSDIGYVPSGVIEIIRKQEEGYAYLRP
jgi:uncharacterized protein